MNLKEGDKVQILIERKTHLGFVVEINKSPRCHFPRNLLYYWTKYQSYICQIVELVFLRCGFLADSKLLVFVFVLTLRTASNVGLHQTVGLRIL